MIRRSSRNGLGEKGDSDGQVRAARVTSRGAIAAALIGAMASLAALIIGGTTSNTIVWVGWGGPYPQDSLPAPATVTETVTVTEPPPEPPTEERMTYIEDLDQVEGSELQAGPELVASDEYLRSVSAASSCSVRRESTFRLDRLYRTFNATIGPSEDTTTGISIVFVVEVDGNPQPAVSVLTDEKRALNIDITGADRITLSWQSGGTDCTASDDAWAVWGDAAVTS